jgi:hypothetical protein
MLDKFYKLKDLENMVELKPRSLKLRMLVVKKKYKTKPTKLYKKGNRWYIHESIVYEFDRKRNNLNEKEYKSFVSISFDGSRSVDCINEITQQVFVKLQSYFDEVIINYTIEHNRSQILHLHFITNITTNQNNKKILHKLFNMYDVIFDMKYITNFRNLENYLSKDFVYKKTLRSQNPINSIF